MSSSFFILLLLPLISAQSFHYGSCPAPAVQPDFDLQEYMGTWYEIEKIPSYFDNGECLEVNYLLKKDGTIQVLNSHVILFHLDFVTILSRSPSLPDDMVLHAKELLMSEGIDVSEMEPNKQDCHEDHEDHHGSEEK